LPNIFINKVVSKRKLKCIYQVSRRGKK